MDETRPSGIDSVFYELQALRKLYERLIDEMEDTKSETRMLKEHQEKIDKILITGNGTPSLQESFRAMNTKLDNFITDVFTERTDRKKKDEEWRSRWFWAFVSVAMPSVLSFIIYLVIHLIRSAPVIP